MINKAFSYIQINGVIFSKEDIQKQSFLKKGSSTLNKEILEFLLEWFSPKDTINVYTSGSTGKPKQIFVKKESMIASALLTCNFLGLRPNDTALLCLPLKYIAGKMMVVRALALGLNLISINPRKNPLKDLKQAPLFAAMVPMQVYNSLKVAKEKELLKQIKHLIIGGSSIDYSLEEELKNFPNAIWSTYGMTETLSHIALRRLSGPNSSKKYTPLGKVKVRLSQENTLIISAPHLFKEEIFTNDIAEIDKKGNFLILGRKDNIINSGAIKIQIELLEDALKKVIFQPFMITSIKDNQYGEAVTLLLEGKAPNNLEEILSNTLPPYWKPKHIISIARLPRTNIDKLDRISAKKIAMENL